MNTTRIGSGKSLSVLARCVVAGLAYALASVAAALLLGPLSSAQATLGNFLLFALTGTLLCLALSPFILHSVKSFGQTVLSAWGLLVLVRSLGLGIEGALFKPRDIALTLAGTASGILISLLVTWLLVRVLWSYAASATNDTTPSRGWWAWTWRVLLVGLAYMVLYIVSGATNALLYTLAFYNPTYGLAVPPAQVIFLALLIRGPLFGAGSYIILRGTDLPRRAAGLWLGALLYVVGGLGPYVEGMFRTMPLGFNLATLAELFFQNFLTGLVAARLYK
jgi:hypothetical protein